MRRVLIAGVGNIFHGDDGFGVAVAQELAGTQLPDGVQLCDYGVAGLHLAYQMLDGYDLVVIVDATQRGEAPGTLYLIEPGSRPAGAPEPVPMVDAHGMTPDAVLSLVPRLGGEVGRVLVVGCEPACLRPGIGLSAQVEDSVGRAARLVLTLIGEAGEEGAVEPGGARHA
jgi:hydrogenase maturation protease